MHLDNISIGEYMTQLEISLPDDLQKFVEAEAAAGRYGSPAAYVQDVLRALWKEKAKAQLEQVLVMASESGPPIEVTAQFWSELKSRVRQRTGIVAP